MFEGKHIHFSPLSQKPLCSYSGKLCKQRRIHGFAFCIRHILEDKSAPFKQCAHVARYNRQKCTNPIPSSEDRQFCNSHMQVAGMLPKKERKIKKEKEKDGTSQGESKLKFADRLKALLTKENSVSASDDTFNSDDPYAFPDPSSETENSILGFSASPTLKNSWNGSQKSSHDASSLDSPSRCDSSSKNNSSTDNKPKSNAPKLSKTMNRLHAKIAQNKLLDKQKKTQDASHASIALMNVHSLKSDPLSPMEVTSVHSESNEAKSMSEITKADLLIKIEPVEEHARSEDSLVSNSISSPNPPSILQADSHLSSGVNSCSSQSEKFFSGHEKSPTPSDLSSKDKPIFESIKESKAQARECSKVPLVLRKIHRIFKNRKKKDKYIFPLGIDSSESESSDSEEENHLFSQLSWFCAWDKRNSCSIDSIHESREAQHARLKRDLMSSYQQLCRLQTLHKQEREHRLARAQPLIEAARTNPNETTQILLDRTKGIPLKSRKGDVPETLKQCCYRQGDVPCTGTALPFAWHCKRHIMYNIDQLLFEHCTAKFSDNTQCCVPVFDVLHELPLCLEHAKKRDNYQKMVSEPKPKKARKKPKPSALTRPPKRGKKKKKPAIRPASPFQTTPVTTIPITSVASTTPPVSELPNVTYSENRELPEQPMAPSLDKNAPLTAPIHSEMTCELEELSPGAIDKNLELPLDAVELASHASKLLEEHDLNEVLNKIPDDAFNDLFVDAKNGDYIPSMEETEELERALAAVSKDIHMAKESLAKLSSGNVGPDLEELERSIDIHGGLLGAENLTSAIDDGSFPELNSSHIDSLNIISSSFPTCDLNSLTQALSAIAPEGIDQTHLTTSNPVSLPMVNSDLSHPLLNGQAELYQQLPIPDSTTPFPDNNALLSAVLYNLGHSSTEVLPPQQNTFQPNGVVEDVGLLSNNQWLLSAQDQVLALSQLAYQNGFLLPPHSSAPYANSLVSKYPLLDLNTEMPLGGSDPQVAPPSDSVICNGGEQSLHPRAPPSSVKVIVQEGAS